MNPYVGAPVVVNVAAQHNGGSPHAAALVTAVQAAGDGTSRVNVRVLYDASPDHPLARHRAEHLTDVAFHSGVTPVEGNKGGLFGAFWPAGSLEIQIALILDQQEFIMTELSTQQTDIDNATAAINAASETMSTVATTVQGVATTVQGVATDVGTVAANVATAIAALPASVDTTGLDTAMSGFTTPLANLQTAATALKTAATALSSADEALDTAASSASTAAGTGTAGTTEPASAPTATPVTGGDTGAAS